MSRTPEAPAVACKPWCGTEDWPEDEESVWTHGYERQGFCSLACRAGRKPIAPATPGQPDGSPAPPASVVPATPAPKPPHRCPSCDYDDGPPNTGGKLLASQPLCRCGSGAHPRRCAIHPKRYAEHCAELSAENARQPDGPAYHTYEMLSNQDGVVHAWIDGKPAIVDGEAVARQPDGPGEAARLAECAKCRRERPVTARGSLYEMCAECWDGRVPTPATPLLAAQRGEARPQDGKQCGACTKGNHGDCSGWCFCPQGPCDAPAAAQRGPEPVAGATSARDFAREWWPVDDELLAGFSPWLRQAHAERMIEARDATHASTIERLRGALVSVRMECASRESPQRLLARIAALAAEGLASPTKETE